MSLRRSSPDVECMVCCSFAARRYNRRCSPCSLDFLIRILVSAHMPSCPLGWCIALIKPKNNATTLGSNSLMGREMLDRSTAPHLVGGSENHRKHPVI